MVHKPVSKEWIAFSRLRGWLENYKSMSLIPPSQSGWRCVFAGKNKHNKLAEEHRLTVTYLDKLSK
ncbi:hypothetical protein HCH54_006753 [Aspergillus fumigatus]